MSKKNGVFTNSAGRRFEIAGISPLTLQYLDEAIRAEWTKSGRLPPCPTYEVENAAGEKIRLPHDHSTEKSPEEQKAWDAYLNAQRRMNEEISEKILNLILLDCVIVAPEDLSAWKSKMRALGISAPEDEAEQKLAFGKTEVVRAPEDIADLLVAVMRLTPGINEEAVKAAEKQFRRALQEAAAGGVGEPPS